MQWKSKLSKEQENRLAKTFKGKRTPGSGSKWYCKGDVKCRNFLIEAKLTKAGVFKFSVGVWNKIVREAISAGKIPLLCVELRGEGVVQRQNYIIFNPNDFEEFLEMECGDSCIMNRVAQFNVEFIRSSSPFEICFEKARLIMMKERDFLDELGLV